MTPGGAAVGIHWYRLLHLKPDEFIDNIFRSFRLEDDLQEIEAEEVNNELATRRGVTRRFTLRVYTIDRLPGDLTILAQETQPPHTWVHISINAEHIQIQTVD
jgi:hypothetical protein